MTIYLNGELKGTQSYLTERAIQSNTNAVYVGGYDTAFFYQGKIDDISLYNYNLSEAKITAKYNEAGITKY